MAEDEPIEAEAKAEQGAPPPSYEQLGLAYQQWQDDYLAQLDRTLADQDVDIAWSREASAQLTSGFEALAPSSSVEVSGCGSTLCKVELSHSDPTGHEQLQIAIQDHFPWPGPGFLAPAPPEQGPKTIMYVGRLGTQLPSAMAEVTDYL